MLGNFTYYNVTYKSDNINLTTDQVRNFIYYSGDFTGTVDIIGNEYDITNLSLSLNP